MKRRKITVHGIRKVPIDRKALIKLIRCYYKGSKNIIVHFKDMKDCWGEHEYKSRSKTHHIRISPIFCRYDKRSESRNFETGDITGHLSRMNHHDTMMRIIQVLLHELRHAKQCDDNPIAYARHRDSNPEIYASSLKYHFSSLETDAEGWSLLRLPKAVERYKKWCNG